MVWTFLWSIHCWIVLTMASIIGEVPDNKGREFAVAFMQNDRFSTNHAHHYPEIYLTTESANSVTINITLPNAKDIMADKVFQVTRGRVVQVRLPNEVLASGMNVEKKGMKITADEEIVVYGINKAYGSSDSFMGLPTDVLGKEYFAASYWDPKMPSKSELVVVAIEKDTTVHITLPASNTSVPYFEFEGVALHSGDQFNVTLQPYETFQVQSATGDLTGTRVVGDRRIAVFSGSDKTVIEGVTKDHLVEQLPPVNRWGRQFVTVPIAMRQVGDVFRVIASNPGTEVRVKYNESAEGTFLLTTGEYKELKVTSADYLFISSKQPVQVVQYAKSQDADFYETDPFMIIIPPTPQFGNLYTFSTVKPAGADKSFINFINIFVEETKSSGIIMDHAPLPKLNWTSISGTGYVGGQLPVSEGTHMVWHTSPVVGFGAVIYGHSQFESYGHPAGMRLAPLGAFCNASNTRAGDGLNNDCDDKVDEELANGIDDDGDGLVDEDLAHTLNWKEVLKTTPEPTTEPPTTTTDLRPTAENSSVYNASVSYPTPSRREDALDSSFQMEDTNTPVHSGVTSPHSFSTIGLQYDSTQHSSTSMEHSPSPTATNDMASSHEQSNIGTVLSMTSRTKLPSEYIESFTNSFAATVAEEGRSMSTTFAQSSWISGAQTPSQSTSKALHSTLSSQQTMSASFASSSSITGSSTAFSSSTFDTHFNTITSSKEMSATSSSSAVTSSTTHSLHSASTFVTYSRHTKVVTQSFFTADVKSVTLYPSSATLLPLSSIEGMQDTEMKSSPTPTPAISSAELVVSLTTRTDNSSNDEYFSSSTNNSSFGSTNVQLGASIFPSPTLEDSTIFPSSASFESRDMSAQNSTPPPHERTVADWEVWTNSSVWSAPTASNAWDAPTSDDPTKLTVFGTESVNVGSSISAHATMVTRIAPTPTQRPDHTTPKSTTSPTKKSTPEHTDTPEEMEADNLPSTVAIMVVAILAIPTLVFVFFCLRATNCKQFAFFNKRHRAITSQPVVKLENSPIKPKPKPKEQHVIKAKRFLSYSNSKEILSEIPFYCRRYSEENKNLISLNAIPPTPKRLSVVSDVMSDISQTSSCTTMTTNPSNLFETSFNGSVRSQSSGGRVNFNYLGDSLGLDAGGSFSSRGSGDDSQCGQWLTAGRTEARASVTSISVVRINLKEAGFHDS